MHKSELLLIELKAARNKAEEVKIIRRYFCEVHLSAVEQTVIAKNKKEFIIPNFND